MHRYYVGGDIGRLQDPGAICVVKRVPELIDYGTPNTPYWAERPQKLVTHYDLVRLEQPGLGGRYAEYCDRVHQIMNVPALLGQSVFVMDATGVGSAVFEMMQERGVTPIVPVVITAGESISRSGEGWYRVPKTHLVAPTQLAFQARRLHYPATLALKQKFIKQLLEFTTKTTRSNNTLMEGDGPDSDDLVLTVALALWYAEFIEKQSMDDGLVEELHPQDDYDPMEYGFERRKWK